MISLEGLPSRRRELATRAFEFCDQFWDDERALVKAPPGGGFGDVHLLQGSAWYAYGLLLRGDRPRAARCIDAMLELQYDEPGAPWHGTFARFAESPPLGPNAVMWVDWDPNWRQFIGTALALMRQDFGAVVDIDRALELCVEGEPDGRVPTSYSNIALMLAWLEAEVGDRTKGERLAAEVVDLFFAHGAFDEFNSPTYYGVDLYALGLWTERSSSPLLRELGARVEAALWRDIARWYHSGLGNLCGPYSRAYGMDMGRHVGGLGLWMANVLGVDRAPLPGFERDVSHGHDYLIAPIVAALGTRLPDDVDLTAPVSEHTNQQQLADGRVASGWLSTDVMIGGETNPGDPVSSPSQACPATVHWQHPDGSVAWLAARSRGPIAATAAPGRLEVCWPAPDSDRYDSDLHDSDPLDVRIVVRAPDADPSGVEGEVWSLPGLDVGVEADGLQRLRVERIDDERLQVAYARTGASRLSLRVVTTA